MIQSGDFESAKDFRDDFPKVLEGGKEIVKPFINGKINFPQAKEKAEERIDDTGSLKRIRKFRQWFCNTEMSENIKKLNYKNKSECEYEINRIKRKIKAIEESVFNS